MHFVENSRKTSASFPTNVGCPACRHRGVLLGFLRVPDVEWSHGEVSSAGRGTINYLACLRHCSNSSCRAMLVVFSDSESGELNYPPEVVAFSATTLPPSVMGLVEEAVKCHAAGRSLASAILVRRLLEQLCNQMTADGSKLTSIIATLKTFASMSGEMVGDPSDLRIIMNDDEQVSANKVSHDERALAVELSKQLLTAVYQYGSLRARLLALKVAPGM